MSMQNACFTQATVQQVDQCANKFRTEVSVEECVKKAERSNLTETYKGIARRPLLDRVGNFRALQLGCTSACPGHDFFSGIVKERC